MQVFELAAAILLSIGSAGGILFALSSWLGKVWASRILEKERTELAILKETFLREHNEKITTYKSVVDVVSKYWQISTNGKLVTSTLRKVEKHSIHLTSND